MSSLLAFLLFLAFSEICAAPPEGPILDKEPKKPWTQGRKRAAENSLNDKWKTFIKANNITFDANFNETFAVHATLRFPGVSNKWSTSKFMVEYEKNDAGCRNCDMVVHVDGEPFVVVAKYNTNGQHDVTGKSKISLLLAVQNFKDESTRKYEVRDSSRSLFEITPFHETTGVPKKKLMDRLFVDVRDKLVSTIKSFLGEEGKGKTAEVVQPSTNRRAGGKKRGSANAPVASDNAPEVNDHDVKAPADSEDSGKAPSA